MARHRVPAAARHIALVSVARSTLLKNFPRPIDTAQLAAAIQAASGLACA